MKDSELIGFCFVLFVDQNLKMLIITAELMSGMVSTKPTLLICGFVGFNYDPV